jgi:tetratricopeptide (TPR) repeat protein
MLSRYNIFEPSQGTGYQTPLQIKFKYLPLLVLLLFSSCIDKKTVNVDQNSQHVDLSNYLDIIGRANASENRYVVESAIEYIDSIIKNDGEKYIFSIYYDKAQLLYKLQKYNEAVETLQRTKNNYDIQMAALLIRMSKNNEAMLILRRFLTNYLKQDTLTEKDIEVLCVVSLLSDGNLNEILNDCITLKGAQDIFFSKQSDFGLTKEDLLQSMWPENTIE